MVEGIRHIIFDLGGVLLNLEYARSEQAFAALGIHNFTELCSPAAQSELFNNLETGKITAAQFSQSIRDLSGLDIRDEEIAHAWNSLICDFPLRRLQILQQLQLYYDLVLLSNTNEIHEPHFNKVLHQSHGIPNIGVFFDRVYYSHKVGMRKPSRAIFDYVLADCGFDPAHTLFIDDSHANISAANEAGIRSIWLEKGMTIEDHIFKSMENPVK